MNKMNIYNGFYKMIDNEKISNSVEYYLCIEQYINNKVVNFTQ